ncbi:ecto-NOX disulfide-thiol exchanger 2 isoform X1 [Bicyclus anynana]|uniref:Ecto-NOX disulfide-thiol exchanger 2 isoform X1 n=2 Tax=Bicyclus anynana TaxID=110368 RepID=A0A6J1NMI5_BICAN|nr:ecto-NOX disulfide-thiol exchanger 2 isoform X1 [Bicyclus anynana]
MSGRRDRSRSPVRGNRREKAMDPNKNDPTMSTAMMNPMMMQSMMMSQGNMMLPGMYNMMMPNAMLGSGMMPSTGMEMMQSSAMDMSAIQPQIDMSAMGTTQTMATSSQSMDMGMMSGMMMDPMMGMYSNVTGEIQEAKEIVLKHCKLIPPTSGSPHPPRRAKPPGCRTIFVGGLPEKIRESHVRDIFERYGRIHILRLSKKNFCHIRFDRETCVDAAMVISGYRVKLLSKEKDEDDEDSQATNGWLHVDYALSRDDQNEYERRQRQAMRVQQQQMQQQMSVQENMASRNMNYRRSPSPVRIQVFSNAAMVQLGEKIKSEEHFASSLPTLVSWLERGECSKKTSTQFYSMIQATNSHIRRLFGEKMQAEEEFQECKERVKNHIQSVIEQLEQVAKVFTAATHQRVWDHFTKPQRKNIETWQKMTQEFHALKEEFNDKFYNEESEFNGYTKGQGSVDNEEVQQLKRENESLQFQLEAYKNEVDVIKADAQKEMEKFKAQFIARQLLQGAMDKNPPLPSPVVKPPPPPPLPDDMETKVMVKDEVDPASGEAKLIGVMSAFLQVHPQGASLDYVVSYVRALFPGVSQASIHHVLQKHDEVFQRTTSGVGANIENRWTFVAFAGKA